MLDLAAGLGVVVLAHAGYTYLFMERRERILGVANHLFIELFALAQACVLDLHVLGSGETDEALCKVGDAHRLAHVEGEYLAAVALHAGLEHQLTGLGDEHEEADDVGMGHCDRTTVLDLLLEDGDNTAVAAEHVTETGGDELGLALHLAVFLGLVEALDVDLADTLTAAHHVRGVHSLVGGDHDELLHPVLHGHVGHDLGRVDVVEYCLGRIVLHHGHVLVGGGVEDVVGFEAAEVEIHAGAVADRCDDGLDLDVRIVARHLDADVVLGGFGLVDEHHGCRAEGCDLTHDLAADGASRTGDEDAATLDLVGQGVEVHLYLLAWKKVFDADFLELRGTVGLGVPLGDIGGHVNLCPRGDYAILELLVAAEVVVPERRDEHRGDLVLLEDVGEVRIGLVHLDAHEMGVVEGRVVRNEALYHVTGRFFAVDALGDCNAALLDAIDKGAGGGFGLIGRVVEILNENPDKEHDSHKACSCHYDLHAAGVSKDVYRGQVGEEMQAEGDHGSACNRVDYLQQVHEGRIAHHHRIGVEEPEEQQLRDEVDGGDQQQRAKVFESSMKTYEEAVCDDPGKVVEEAVHQDYNPIRRSLFGEVPV